MTSLYSPFVYTLPRKVYIIKAQYANQQGSGADFELVIDDIRLTVVSTFKLASQTPAEGWFALHSEIDFVRLDMDCSEQLMFEI